MCENNEIKIGITTDIQQRVKQLCRCKPSNLLCVYISNPFSDKTYIREKIIHKLLEQYKIKGEWFCCSLEKVIQIINDVCDGGVLIEKDSFFCELYLTSTDYLMRDKRCN